MSTLYHKHGRLSRAKTEFYCKTSAPRKPTKQAPKSNNKNVILFSFHSIIYYRHSQAHNINKKREIQKFFSENNCRKSFDSNNLRRWRRASLSFYRLSISQMSQPDKPAQPKINSVQAAYINKSNLLRIIFNSPLVIRTTC